MIARHAIAIAACIGVNEVAYAVQHWYPSAGVLAGWFAALIYVQLLKGIKCAFQKPPLANRTSRPIW